MQIEIKSPAVAAKWATVLWTVAMWLWLLIEAIGALGEEVYEGSPFSAVAVESAQVLVLWFLVVIPLIAGTMYLKKQEAGAPTEESEDAVEPSS